MGTSFIIHDWFINKLNLKSHDLIIFALIYSFSKDGKSEYYGSLSFLEGITGANRRTVIRVLNNLVERNLVLVNRDSGKTNKYRVNIELVTKLTYCNSTSDKNTPELVTNFPLTSDKINPNNNIYNNIYNKEQNNNPDKPLNKTQINNYFCKIWSEKYKQRFKKETYLKKLPEGLKEDVYEIYLNNDKEYLDKIIIALFKQEKYFSDSMYSDPRHLIKHHLTYRTAYDEQNANIYGEKKKIDKL